MAEKKETEKPGKKPGEEKKTRAKAPAKNEGTGRTGKTRPEEKAEDRKAGQITEKEEKEKKEEKKESYLKDIMAVGGHPGLYRYVSQGRNGIILESLESGKRMQAFATMKVSSLDDIAIYTGEEEIKLEEVFNKIYKYENGGEAISHKSGPDDLKDYFSVVVPEYDRERVYVSDIKKVLQWYNTLLKYEMLKTDKPEAKAKTGEKKTG